MTTPPSGRLATARHHLSRAIDNSRLVGVAGTVEGTLGRWGRASRFVGWFVAEPDPGVVVVSLRESSTVGPVLRILTRVGGRTRRLAERSGLDERASTAASRIHAAGRIDAAPLRWLGVVVVTAALLGTLAWAVAGRDVGGWLLLVGAALLATRDRRSASELAETRVGRALAAAFEPPDAPGRDDE